MDGHDQRTTHAYGQTSGRAPRRWWRRGAFGVALGLGLMPGLLALAGCSTSPTVSSGPSPTPSVTATATPTSPAPTATATATTYPVKVYFSKHPETDSNALAVFPVNRVSPTSGVATYAIQQLLAGPTAAEASAGYFTELKGALSGPSNCGGADFTIALNMRGSKAEPGTATLRFCRTLSVAGELAGARMKAELDATLKQFPTIKQDIVLNQSGQCFDDLSGQDRCLQS